MSEIWKKLRDEAEIIAAKERILSKILTEYILERSSFADALSCPSLGRCGVLELSQEPCGFTRELALQMLLRALHVTHLSRHLLRRVR